MVSRRAILGVLIGAGGGAAAFTQLGNDTDAPATDQESGLVADDSSSPTPTTTEAHGSNVDTLTPRDGSPTPTEQPAETATETRAPTETETTTETTTETATRTPTPTQSVARTSWQSDVAGRVEFVLAENYSSNVDFLGWGRTTQTDDGTVYPTLRVRTTAEIPKVAARAELQGDFSTLQETKWTLSGLHVVSRLEAGETVNLRPAFEPHEPLERVVFEIDDSKRVQSPTPTPTPTDSGFL
jgi:hypothetical protein